MNYQWRTSYNTGMDDPDAYQHHRLPKSPQHQFRGQAIISDQMNRERLAVVWDELARVLAAQVPGDVIEFGCYAGTTSLFIRRLLDEQGQSGARAFHVYDSFAGLPPKAHQDQSAAGVDFAAGKLAVSKKTFVAEFRAARLQLPVVHKGWFNDLGTQDVPATIAFAFLDGDFYDSIYTALGLVWPRMQPGGLVLIDDYQRAELPGATTAVSDFFGGRPPALQVRHTIAILRKG